MKITPALLSKFWSIWRYSCRLLCHRVRLNATGLMWIQGSGMCIIIYELISNQNQNSVSGSSPPPSPAELLIFFTEIDSVAKLYVEYIFANDKFVSRRNNLLLTAFWQSNSNSIHEKAHYNQIIAYIYHGLPLTANKYEFQHFPLILVSHKYHTICRI